MQSFVEALFGLSILSLAHASPAALIDLEKRGCTSDNCLRALKGHSSDASTYCATYTAHTQTATTSFPTYIPSTCGPSRVSSACSCLKNTGIPTTVSTTTTTTSASSKQPTTTSSSTTPSLTSMTSTSSRSTSTGPTSTCAINLPYYSSGVVENPSFYIYYNETDQDQTYDTYFPWDIGNDNESGGCDYHNSYDTCDQNGGDFYQDPDCLYCRYEGTFSQNISWCPGVNYTFKTYTYCDRQNSVQYVPGSSYPSGAPITAYLDDILIAGPTPACPECPYDGGPNPYGDDPCQDCFDNTDWNVISGHVIGPASGKGVLRVEVGGDGYYPTVVDTTDLYA